MLLTVGIALITVACGIGAIIFVRGYGFQLDLWWNSVMQAWVSPVMLAVSQAMNEVGRAWLSVFVVPALCAASLLLTRRPWSALFFLTAALTSAGSVQILKRLVGRARPEDILVVSDYGSFPSGHTANAATLATVAVMLFPRVWVLLVAIAWLLLMALSRTYLHAHWLTDTLGGALVGIGVVMVLAAAYGVPLSREIGRRPVSNAPRLVG